LSVFIKLPEKILSEKITVVFINKTNNSEGKDIIFYT